MAKYIEMPKLSDTMTEGTLLKWKKKEGDKVATGDVIAEVETDKATMEVEAFDDGTIHKFLVQEGSKVQIGGRLALLLSKGETAPKDGEEPATESAKTTSAKADTIAPPAAPAAESSGRPAPAKASASPATGGRIKASPLARKIAAANGVDLSSLTGTGPSGRIVAKDVESAPTSASPKAPAASAAPAIAAAPAGAGDQRIALSGMRRVIAERLLTSKTTIPHFYLNIEVDAGPLMKFRGEANAASEAAGGPKLTVNDFVLKAVIAAAAKVPAVNASFAGDAIIQYGSINLAVAVAVDDGLVTPVIRDAQKKTLREISELVKDLATRARSKKLKPEEYQGGTITVSNLGSYGIDSFSAIINPPQAMIIAVGAIVKKPVVNAKDEIVAGQRLAIGLSADHRVVDGAVGAQYLAELRKLIESPTLMLL
ncbi:MAG TPA: pyruvate dehydrogenase complex dihydrolipoamide acetyltransferase [Chthoniobacteraceae bacterium]|nr:pyruvate dehydrogenase complex dihydrolipoamide acetyltransferase [Chthoniobacteraceae bacterium]